ncbi:MAG: hypothetical protein HPY59_08485 [Anaerolineae bacterium]|nr:hypothetical protein [Anaerolineae bacterium]
MTLKRTSFLLIMMVWVASACSLLFPLDNAPAAESGALPVQLTTTPVQESGKDISPSPQPVEAALTPAVAGGGPDVGGGGEVYPQTPEMVVNAFLTAYQDNPVEMSSFLGAARLLSMPEGGVNALLGVTGKLEGFAIQSAAVNPDPPEALLEVGLAVDGSEMRRRFHLSFENGRWVIENIETIVP